MSAVARAPAAAHSQLVQRVFATLADGEEHSGASLAAGLDVTRSAVWKAIEQLRDLGLPVSAATRRGYRLAYAAEALDAARIRAAVTPPEVRERFDAIDVLWSGSSTNTLLLERRPPPPGRFDAILVEHQSAGRGRRGRAWLAPVAGSLCLSIAVQFEQPPPGLGALPLCAGLAIAAALESLGARDFGLKWPNDLVARPDGRKFGGLLAELRVEAGGPAHVVIGLGLNLRLSDAAIAAVADTGTRATDLARLGLDPRPRNALAGRLLATLATDLQRFAVEGFAPIAPAWDRVDVLRDRVVTVSGGLAARADGALEGVARGIDPDGALRLELASGRIEHVIAGEVSVRPVPPSSRSSR
jgi:BirA family biotin operon repressor/biotin-[acetyl-CoA-carboxylase] ligase